MNFQRLNMSLNVTFAIAALLAIVSATGCAKKTKPEESNSPSTESALDNAMGDSDSGKAMGLQTIHFAYDSASLDQTNKGLLSADGAILKANPGLKVQIEGHTDSRGGIQYNIALGEKRANSVKAFLTDMGINGDRISVISFGKERPVDSGSSDDAYAKNRRANFAITSR